VLAFGSSTASSVSARAYATAEELRQELITAARTRRLDGALDHAIASVRRGILEACAGTGLGGVEVVLNPSGTDSEYAALHLARTGSHTPIVNVVMAPQETGSGVLAAAQGRRFAHLTPSGEAVSPDAPLAGFGSRPDPGAERADPRLRRPARAARRHRRRGGGAGRADRRRRPALPWSMYSPGQRRLFAPSLEAVRRLRAHSRGEIEVVLDACQLRLSPERIRACVEAGWMVPLSGSKFFGGPPFAGALVVPREIVTRAREAAPLRVGLAGYFSRPEWPPALQHLTTSLPEAVNLGLLLRWHAALTEGGSSSSMPRRRSACRRPRSDHPTTAF
jgi:hypothetical protein